MDPVKFKALELVASIARMKYDGEELEDGEEFVMENDDAVDTVNSLIHTARMIMKEAE